MVNDPSVRVLTANGGFGEDFQIRGFPVPSGDVGLNGLFGLLSANRVAAEVVERVEVLKGPGALLNGMSPNGSIGGGINVVTKRAADISLTRFTTTYRSDSQIGGHLDVGRRFGEDNSGACASTAPTAMAKPTSTTRTRSGRRRDRAGLRRAAPALVARRALAARRPRRGAPPGQLPDDRSPPRRAVVPREFLPGNQPHLRDETIATRLEYDLTDRITAFAGIGSHRADTHQLFANGWADSAGDFTQNAGYYDSYRNTVSGDAGLRGRFRTGAVGHALVLSASRLEQEFGYFYSGAVATPSNLYNPARVPALPFARNRPGKSSDLTLSSVALADTLSMFDERLLLTLGARDQTVETLNFDPVSGAQTARYKEGAVTPMLGLVVKAAQAMSIYGNYIEGLSPGATAPATAANAGETFAPYKSKQHEAGVKYDWAGWWLGQRVPDHPPEQPDRSGHQRLQLRRRAAQSRPRAGRIRRSRERRAPDRRCGVQRCQAHPHAGRRQPGKGCARGAGAHLQPRRRMGTPSAGGADADGPGDPYQRGVLRRRQYAADPELGPLRRRRAVPDAHRRTRVTFRANVENLADKNTGCEQRLGYLV